MKELIVAVGLLFVIEGLLYTIFPTQMKGRLVSVELTDLKEAVSDCENFAHCWMDGIIEANDQSKSGSPLFFPANTFARQGDCSARSVQFDVASLGDKKNEAQKRRKSRKGELVRRPQPRALRREHLGMYRAPQDVTKKC